MENVELARKAGPLEYEWFRQGMDKVFLQPIGCKRNSPCSLDTLAGEADVVPTKKARTHAPVFFENNRSVQKGYTVDFIYGKYFWHKHLPTKKNKSFLRKRPIRVTEEPPIAVSERVANFVKLCRYEVELNKGEFFESLNI